MTRQLQRHRDAGRVAGFSIVEWLLAVTITAILAAFIMPVVLNSAERTRISRARADVAGLAKAIAKMRQDTGVTTGGCLTNLGNLQSGTLVTSCTNANATTYTMTACTASQIGQACWGGPYLGIVSPDPWGNPYRVSIDANSAAVIVWTTGPDMSPGTPDDVSYVQ